MTEPAILVLDEGTTSTRAVAYAPSGAALASSQAELTQHYPRPGWVEHDADELWQRTLACAREVVATVGAARVAAIGIANQRETVVAWDRATGRPITRAIVWQDRRTALACDALREAGHEPLVQQRTGLVLDPYFSATKLRWILDHVPEARVLGPRLALGTVESWLVWKLTGGIHLSDASNASRTMLMALGGKGWDEGLLDLIGVPRAILPEIVDSAGAFGTTSPEWFGAAIPICGLAGDQQAATIGQACLAPGDTKATLGTGAFVLSNVGAAPPASHHRLLATVLCQQGGERTYALEGSVFMAGSLMRWLRDQLGLISSAGESEALARSVPDNGGVCIVPAHAGLGAPHWRADLRGAIGGLTQGSTRAHLVRAALEAVAHQLHDLQQAFAADGAPWRCLRLDGGMSANDWLAQDIADVLCLSVERPRDTETTALGAAMLAGVGCGLFGSLEEAAAMRAADRVFAPAMDNAQRDARLALWRSELAKQLGG